MGASYDGDLWDYNNYELININYFNMNNHEFYLKKNPNMWMLCDGCCIKKKSQYHLSI